MGSSNADINVRRCRSPTSSWGNVYSVTCRSGLIALWFELLRRSCWPSLANVGGRGAAGKVHQAVPMQQFSRSVPASRRFSRPRTQLEMNQDRQLISIHRVEIGRTWVILSNLG